MTGTIAGHPESTIERHAHVTDQLAEDQLVTFDREYVDDRRWVPIRAGLDQLPPTFEFIDVGGGNGVFADRVLDSFPSARGVIGDNAAVLLERNRASPRKRTVELNAMALPAAALGRFDVVFLNWVLHHLVATGDYGTTRQNIVRTLADARWLIAPGGRLSVYENMYDGVGPHNLPSHLVFTATSMRRLAPITRKLGANTAGVGVCFQSERSWRKIFGEAGYEIEQFTPGEPWPMATAKRLALSLRRVRVGHFWLRPR